MESKKDGTKLIADALKSGKALQKFCEMLKAQGVQPDVAQKLCTPGTDPFSVLPLASQNMNLFTEKSGIVSEIDALALAKVSHELGAGRQQSSSSIDHGVGMVLSVRVGQFITKGSKWLTVHHNGNLSESQIASLRKAVGVDETSDTADLPMASRIIDIIDK